MFHRTAGGAHLEILAHLYADLFGRGVGRLTADAPHKQTADNRQVEGIEGRFEGDNAHVGILGVLREVHCAYGGCGDIQQLPMGCLVCGLCTTDSIKSAPSRYILRCTCWPSNTEMKYVASRSDCGLPVNPDKLGEEKGD